MRVKQIPCKERDTWGTAELPGLVASGSKVFYRVYVIVGTGNEKGSRTVNVVRP